MPFIHPFRWIRRALYLVVFAVVAYLAVTSAQVLAAGRAPTSVGAVHPAAAIVLVADAQPGAGKGNRPSADLFARCRHVVTLRSAHRATSVIVVAARTQGGGQVNEAAVAARYLESLHVPAVDLRTIVGKDVPAALAAVARDHPGGAAGQGQLLVVADPLQTLWLEHVAASAKLRYEMSPSTPPSMSAPSKAGDVVIQAFAVGWGRIFGSSSTGWIAG